MRSCLLGIVLVCSAWAADPASQTLRGKLIIEPGQAPVLETADHKRVILSGDETTQRVLTDPRLNSFQIEAKGKYTSPGRFEIHPSHEHSMLVKQDGKLKVVTYWCDVCAIRSYTPGLCVCCQKETLLDLRDPDNIQ